MGSARGIPLTPGRMAGLLRQPRWWSEILLGLAVFGVYLLVKAFPLPAHTERALANGRDILAAEQFLGLDFELPVNLWLADQGWLQVVANYEYAFTYIVTTLVLLVWVYHRSRTEHYPWVRNSFALVNLLALGCFWLYPVAPPRMLSDAGFVDTVRLGGTWGSWGSPMVDGANQFAAMPSLHIGWALWVSVVLARLSGGVLAQVGSAVHVLVTFAVIVATGNHYWLDAVGGVVVVWAAVALVGRRERGVTAAMTTEGAAALRGETPGAPRHGGLLALLDTSHAVPPAATRIRTALAGTTLPWLRRRPVRPTPRRGWSWAEVAEPDWDWHVPEYDLSGPGGRPGGTAALHRLVEDLLAAPLPRDRPLWRLAMVRGFAEGQAALVALTHDALTGAADPAGELIACARAHPGPAEAAEAAPAEPPRSAAPAARRFGTLLLDREPVEQLAGQAGAGEADVLLSAVAGALNRVATPPLPPAARVSVDLPGARTRQVEVPLGGMPERERLAAVAAGNLVPGTSLPVDAVQRGTPAAGAEYPIVPPAPGAALGAGVRAQAGGLAVGVVTDAAVVDDVERFLKEVRAVLDELALESRRG
ncbi:phosphatase PAP2 family protein [Prauserella muralis]|uniref:phosphatase PAP2 family protein n=1 Tax=Prauserella muralis TaxID=588067 RepID=UPI0011AD6BCE|nr:phosphatase PAP2 family protein [Prauserella muralis]TWE29035.1 wax ester synthase-like acyl-CoA acyltransferase family protein [Prauserella muralis]